MIKVGIDVGGTNTDAVLLDGNRIATAVKVSTSDDVTAGIRAALGGLVRTAADLANVEAVIVGTTHFINAVVQRRGLEPVGVIRIGSPASRSLLPYCDWPKDLAGEVNHGIWSVAGGHEYDGRPFAALDEVAIKTAARQISDKGLATVAICSVFSPVNAEHETRAAELVREVAPDIAITLSSSLGRIGILERENVALLNAALIGLARRVAGAVISAVREQGITAPVYFSRNDGTIADIETTIRQPVYSFASGATNSMRGAAFLSGLKEAIVADVGGTTTDVGLLRHGFPHEANSVVEVGGVRTLFRMPDVISIGLGGGSIVAEGGGRIGPQSVGFRLTSEALVFGGTVTTATDYAVAMGLAKIGEGVDPTTFPRTSKAAFMERCRSLVEETVDRAKIQSGDLPLLAVGGGAFLVPDEVAGITEVVRVDYAECANAVGAALAQVSGEVDRIYRDVPRDDALEDARQLAAERAVRAGACRDTLELIDLEEVPLAYLPGQSVRVRARVVGDMRQLADGPRDEAGSGNDSREA